jgi:putative flippase GtrA
LKGNSSRAELFRFVVLGAANTIATYLLYLLALQFVGYVMAYTLSYVAGIGMSYAANALVVFRTPMSVKSAAAYPLVYAFQYLAGLALIAIQIELLSVPAWLAPWVAALILIPASFVLTRRMLRLKENNVPRDHQ